tara:strand:+ start:481 stop:594 length:114 start_codon:yes stop_codon:yes gene_type:complete
VDENNPIKWEKYNYSIKVSGLYLNLTLSIYLSSQKQL